jgi:hypothetical protein
MLIHPSWAHGYEVSIRGAQQPGPDREEVARVTVSEAPNAPDYGARVGGSVAAEPTFEARGIDYIPVAERLVVGEPPDVALGTATG